MMFHEIFRCSNVFSIWEHDPQNHWTIAGVCSCQHIIYNIYTDFRINVCWPIPSQLNRLIPFDWWTSVFHGYIILNIQMFDWWHANIYSQVLVVSVLVKKKRCLLAKSQVLVLCEILNFHFFQNTTWPAPWFMRAKSLVRLLQSLCWWTHVKSCEHTIVGWLTAHIQSS
jgi:hypothetical protein